MRIIKPYGRSHVEDRRVLSLRPDFTEQAEITEFAKTNDELVIAQWISAIDKIATKPKPDKEPTAKQRDFRDRLGKACWALINEKGLLQGNLPNDIDPHTLWQSKVHPYGKKDFTPKGKQKPPCPKGRWFERFAGDVEDVSAVDVDAIAHRIYEHLYEAEYRLSPDAKHPKKQQGKIAGRAESIERNVLKPRTRPAPDDNEARWSKEDECRYAAAGDVAAEIRQEALNRENATPRPRRVTPDIAGKILFEQYGRLFKDTDGAPLPIKKAEERHPGLFALHMAVKDCYSRLLKHHRKKKVSRTLPREMDELFKLVAAKRDNRDLNALIRLGKVIHYESATGMDDTTASVLTNWPQDVTQSRYWTSDGQAEIKRNEAFVRVWRHLLALMQRTATDWADPDGQLGQDILGSRAINSVTGGAFPHDTFDTKLDLLFGSRAELFKPVDPEDLERRKAVLRATLEGLSGLRNSAFHFKGLGGFVSVLRALGGAESTVHSAIDTLWQQDARNRTARVRNTLEGADCAFFLKDHQAEKLLSALTDFTPATLPLPRFNRVIKRANETWKGKNRLSLPAPVSRKDMENSPSVRCRYICLKLLYERPFRHWLETADTETLNGFIDKAVQRGTNAAQTINKKDKDTEEQKLIVAKADKLGGLSAGEKLDSFFFRLSAATATEMRVQRGYESDAAQAQKQAEFIENLKCEILALAFDHWLDREGYEFLLNMSETDIKPDTPICELPKVQAIDIVGKDWQRHLYFLLHLAPVGAVSTLLHQMRKWETLAGKADASDREHAREVMTVLELWLDMHDAKFEGGGTALTGTETFNELFERPEDFGTIFETVTGKPEDDRRIPVRGLREIMRFGHHKPLWSIFEQHNIAASDIKDHLDAEKKGEDDLSEVARLQAQRERLHEKWVKQKKKLNTGDLYDYTAALQKITNHRHRAARVLLTDHARLHDLLMAVLGRLVDYAGLFERDLYFATLALIHEAGKSPQEVLNRDGRDALQKGLILSALNGLKDSTVRPRLQPYFGEVWDANCENRKIRNRFAHFKMLRNNERIHLTKEVKNARKLMAYDRKLKNAVSKSIRELLAREGLDLIWSMAKNHQLENARLSSRGAKHLGKSVIIEPLHGETFVGMAAQLFSGSIEPLENSILNQDIEKVVQQAGKNNAASGKRRNSRKGRKNRGARHGNHGRGSKNFRNKSKKHELP